VGEPRRQADLRRTHGNHFLGTQLLPHPLTAQSVHLCLDMQRIFSAEGPWPTPWMERVLPVVAMLAGRHPERTVFTRFITPQRPEQMPGMWQPYYARWRVATRDLLDPGLLELMPPLAALCPPAHTINKSRYSAFAEPHLLAHLREREADALIISGSETDVCVLATVLGAVDIGYRVIVVRDAVCSSSDEGHDMLMRLYQTRFSEQIETADAETILARWP
jgi:nicotinamidase-related amidase